MGFCFFDIIYLGKKAWIDIWSKLNSLHSRFLCAMFGWNWPSDYINIFSYCFYLPLETGVALHLNKFDSHLPKIGCKWIALLERNACLLQSSFAISLLAALGKSCDSSREHIWILCSLGWFVLSLGQIRLALLKTRGPWATLLTWETFSYE